MGKATSHASRVRERLREVGGERKLREAALCVNPLDTDLEMSFLKGGGL
jgi:hypothetical protein